MVYDSGGLSRTGFYETNFIKRVVALAHNCCRLADMARLDGDSLLFFHVPSGGVDASSLADFLGDPDLGTAGAIGSVE